MPFLTSHPIFLNPPVDKASFITIPSEFSINLIMKESLLNEKISSIVEFRAGSRWGGRVPE